MNNIIDKIIEDKNDYTPESLAWKLLLDDVDTALATQLLGINPDDIHDTDQTTYLFEILITIFMEMIFDIALLGDMTEYENNNNTDYKFNPDLTKVDLNVFLPTLIKKFEHISILLSTEINDIDTDDKVYMQEILDNRYCRVILRHNKDDTDYFIKNGLPNDLNYHMILNSNTSNNQFKKIKDVYAVILLNNKLHKIAFDNII
jgi:hypothetical protein